MTLSHINDLIDMAACSAYPSYHPSSRVGQCYKVIVRKTADREGYRVFNLCIIVVSRFPDGAMDGREGVIRITRAGNQF